MMIAKKFGTTLVSLSLATGLMMAAMPQAMAADKRASVVKNQYGAITVRCHVHEFGTGNAVVGYVVGNDDRDLDAAKKDADDFVSRLGSGGKVTKRHCKTQSRYMRSGAYNTDMIMI